MRKGENITRNTLLELKECSHRVIIPLYIPNEEGYYQDAFKNFKLCLLSVRKTAISPIKISVVSNGSCNTVNSKLQVLQQENHIDELIIETEAIGKINSILKALRTAQERLITITDGDVLFVNNWEKEVLAVFKSFPNAGVVCPVPIFRTHFKLTSNIWLRYLFSKRLTFLPVKNPEAMAKFANSIGWPWLDDKWKDAIGTLKANDGTIAVLGSSHFVATYKREAFTYLPKNNTIYKLGGDSNYEYTDGPVLKMNGYRLTTYDNYAYHLGNTFENWMQDMFDGIKEEEKVFDSFDSLKTLKKKPLTYFISEKIFKKIIRIKRVRIPILKMKGLNNEQINNFLER